MAPRNTPPWSEKLATAGLLVVVSDLPFYGPGRSQDPAATELGCESEVEHAVWS
jgi:hypothetical protein